MYAIEDVHICEPDPFAEPGTAGAKKTLSVTLRCDGYEADSLSSQFGDTISPMGRSEVGSNYVHLTIDYSGDARVVAKRIKAEIAKRKVDRSEEKVLLGQLSQLGLAAINA